MSSFQEILSRALQSRGEGTVPADTMVEIETKGLSLSGTLEVRMRDGEVDEEDITEQALQAAVRRVEDIIDNIISQDVLDARFFTKTSRTRVTGKVNVPTKASGLRDSRGRFLSAINLAKILNLTLFSHVQEHMKEPALVNRTGRLAHSAHVTSINFFKRSGNERKNRASIFFSYMLFPYQVFEKNSKRDPRKLIHLALRDALRKALSPDSFKKNIFNIQADS